MGVLDTIGGAVGDILTGGSLTHQPTSGPQSTTGGSKYDHGLIYVPGNAHGRTLSDSDLRELLTAQGWVHDNNQASCIVNHESSRKTDATSRNPDGNKNVGIFQIDCVNVTCCDCLKDPQYNAAVARRMFTADGNTFAKRWSTASSCASESGSTGPSSEATPDNPVANIGSDIAHGLGGLLGGIPWFRVGKGAMGFVLVAVGASAIVVHVANKAPIKV